MCVKQHIYSVLAAQRRARRISQQELAALAGLRREKVNRIESKGEDVGIDALCRLLDVLGLELSVSPRGQAGSSSFSAPARPLEHPLEPQEFRKAAVFEGAKAKVLKWGRLSR